ncbi:Phosphate regulon transcriptional regulatory protein PhoB [Candidatus Contendobacter odensis Run_B_J11]|uniref:Phosphate regulon transcriptional regulatory protein PhoB n=2 Tax=Candidatus Contendibacter odensensis TaxID=1400860 RepID=A0A7U7J230_9GAMM|nr:Phosphate regulon transcriptional regulatory protein PhoB [Candidatus Contendobacter odensis Run_B_J11]
MWADTKTELEPMARHLLLVEDDREIAALVELHLRDIYCTADITGSGQDALTRYARCRYDLVILDLMLPDLDGLTVCQRLRAGGDYVPILMLTAKSSELDRVLGLELGADDYLVKPFSFPELLARVKALLRRAEALRSSGGATPDDARVTCGSLVIEVSQRRVTLAGRELALTVKEFDLLLHFARQPGRVFSRSQLLDQIWGYSHEGYEHTVNSHINRLRAKLEPNPAEPHYLLTVWGIGYKFTESC